MTIYFPDLSSFQAGANLSGALTAMIKATQGTGYVNPVYGVMAGAMNALARPHLAYHFLQHGNGVAQADHFYGTAGKTPAMIDCEPAPDGRGGWASKPVIDDICVFADRLRSRGGVVHWVYLPRSYWQQLGSPDLKTLRDRGLLLWSANYGTYTDSSSGVGWRPYGGMTPLVWQYSESTPFGGLARVDFNAFRGSVYAGKQDPASVIATVHEFTQLSLTGKFPTPPLEVMPPIQQLTVIGTGPHSVEVRWKPPAASDFKLGWYQFTIRGSNGGDLPKYPRTFEATETAGGTNPVTKQFGSLPPSSKLTVWGRALDAPDKQHASPWEKREIKTPPA